MSKKGTNNTIQAFWIALGNLFTFSFGIVSAMILSRYFSVFDYGTYKQVFYVYNTLLGFFTLGLPKAFSYFLPKAPINEAKSLINKLTKLFFILGAVLSLALFFGANLISSLLENSNLEEPLRLFSPVPFLMMPTLGLEGILASFRKTKFVTIYVLLTRIAMLVCVLCPVMIYKLGIKGAIIGFDIASFISFIIALYLKNFPVRKEKTDPSTETYKDIFKFCFPLFIASIWGILINSTDQFFISHFFGTEVFAVFSNGATELPFVGMILGATTSVLTPLFTKELHNNSNIRETVVPVWKSAFLKSALIIYPLTFFCIVEAESIMTLMYGVEYSASGNFFRIKLVTYFFKIIMFYSMILALGAVGFYQKMHAIFFLILVAFEYVSVILFPNPLLITSIHVVLQIILINSFLMFIAKKLEMKLWDLVPYRKISLISISSVCGCGAIIIWQNLFSPQYSIFFQIMVDLIIFISIVSLMAFIFKLPYFQIIKPLLAKFH